MIAIAPVPHIVLGSAMHSTLKAGQGFTTLTLELKYHRALATKTGKLKAAAQIVTHGRDIATAVAKLIDGRERLFASATSTLMIFAPAAAAPPAADNASGQG